MHREEEWETCIHILFFHVWNFNYLEWWENFTKNMKEELTCKLLLFFCCATEMNPFSNRIPSKENQNELIWNQYFIDINSFLTTRFCKNIYLEPQKGGGTKEEERLLEMELSFGVNLMKQKYGRRNTEWEMGKKIKCQEQQSVVFCLLHCRFLFFFLSV